MYFSQEKTGKHHKLSRCWHGPYQIVSRDNPYITAKIFFPDDSPIQVHQSRVMKCPPDFPSNFYWHGSKRAKPWKSSKQLQKHLDLVDPH